MRGKSVICLLLIIFFVSAYKAGAFSLEEAVKTALERNPEIAAAKSDWEAAQAKIPQTLSLDDPRIGLEYEQIPSGSRNLEDGMKMYTFEQMIMFPGKLAAEYLMAGRIAERFAARYRAKVWEIAAQVKSSYYDLYLADRSIAVAQEITGLLSKVKKTAEAKYSVGGVSQAEVLQANIEYLTMSNELQTLKEEREAAQAKLIALLNQNGETTLKPDGELELPAEIASPEKLNDAALKNRPELLLMKAELAEMDYVHLKSKMDFFPDTALGVKKRVTDGWNAMISFSVPLYFWKQSYGVAGAGLMREAREAAYNNMVNLTRSEVREVWVMADSSKRTAKLYEEEIVPQSSQALKSALAAYQSGRLDFAMLLQIEKTYKEVSLGLYKSRVKFGKALAELERLIGKELI